MDSHFDARRLRVPEGIAHRLTADPVDLVPNQRDQISSRTLHKHAKRGTWPGPNRSMPGREFFSEGW
jgi:hypothetical protein